MWPPTRRCTRKGIVADILKSLALFERRRGRAWLESSWVYFVSGDQLKIRYRLR